MRAVRQFNVVPAIPPRLAALSDLANNIHWTWDRLTQALFSRLDPQLWESGGHDPLRLIAGITESRWSELSADPEVIALTDAAAARLAQATTEPRWFQGRADSPLQLVAYFSPEFGLTETLPQYSGGLGILAGDHLKAASDLGVPLIGVGLLYQAGYFKQSLSRDAWQQETYPVLDPDGLPLTLLREPSQDGSGRPVIGIRKKEPMPRGAIAIPASIGGYPSSVCSMIGSSTRLP